MISGFVICMSSWGRRLGDFFISRVSRLYPAYWACVIITATVAVIAPIAGGFRSMESPTLVIIAANLTMLQEPLGVPSIDPVYWTLFVEVRFYLILAIPVVIGLTYRRVVLFCATWMTVAMMSPLLSNKMVELLLIPDYAPCFIAGMIMYLIHRFGSSPLLLAMLGFTWLVNVHHVSLRIRDAKPGFDVPEWPGILLISLAYLVILSIAMGYLSRIRWRWLTVAGAMTYPLYLLHIRVGYTALRHWYQRSSLPAWVLMAVTLCVMLALAWIVYRVIERPLGRHLQNLLRSGMAELDLDDRRGSRPAPEQRGSVASGPIHNEESPLLWISPPDDHSREGVSIERS